MMHPNLKRAVATAQAGRRIPVAIIDVDLTILDNAPRSRAIFSDWLHSIRDRWAPAGALAIEALTMPIVFGVEANLSTLGITTPQLRREAFAFWLKHFFSGDYCRRDVPMPGAVDAVDALKAHGITIAYLTARHCTMAQGTVATFAKFGLPVGVPGTLLVMKEDPAQGDPEYKEQALAWLGQLGAPVLCADNEPGHANAMHRAFPDALTLLVGDRHSSPSPTPDEAVERVNRLADAVI